MVVEQAGLEYTAPVEEGSLKGQAGIDWSDKSERRAFLNRLVEEARALLAETRDDQAASTEVREAAELLVAHPVPGPGADGGRGRRGGRERPRP